MKKARYDTVSIKHTFITVFGINVLVFLVLISIASATQPSDIPNSGGDFLKNIYENDIKIQDEVLRINPQNSTALIEKGLALDILNRHDEAITVYEKAIQINPQDSEAWTDKGNTLDALGKYDEAIQAYDKAIEINPLDSDAWYNKRTCSR
jgi:tetratricopeptide (TPR) repeat protein